ncbi:hypothetical protein [Solimonas flava]|uniref:hypothetical protein n=1 Tax=Solimonas flava TaxID=415849 RepID=UPI0004839F46|nr:hypothetical protein [Solimonas flava]
MSVQVFAVATIALVALLVWGLVRLFTPTPLMIDDWNPETALAETRRVEPGEDLAGKRIRFSVPTVICQSREQFSVYLAYIRADAFGYARDLVADPDDEEERRCAEMDASNNFHVVRTVAANGLEPSLLELDSGHSGHSDWAVAEHVRIIDKDR